MKEWADWIASVLGLKAELLLPGLIGGILSLRWWDGLTRVGKVGVVLGGIACARYLAPPASAWFELGKVRGGDELAGFMFGLFGMSAAAALAKIIGQLDFDKVRALFPGGRQ
jgi:hypothetical protein